MDKQVRVFDRNINVDKTFQHRDYVNSLNVVVGDIGGESVELTVDVFDNGDKKDFTYTNFHITTHAYGTSKSDIGIYGPGFEAIYEGMKKLYEELMGQKAVRKEWKEKREEANT